ncbi:MAG: acylglycerol kinase family protein, partial [Flavobacteriia bacterium]|nr:acylglycerol kinase family protein [Flavobacteriia bacterium]
MSSSPNTILFLVNPFAGKGKALLIAKNTTELMQQNGYDTELFEGKNKEDFLNFTTIYEINKIQKIAVFGGDGTMHDIINALMLKPEWLS